jgi:hypothetical protein
MAVEAKNRSTRNPDITNSPSQPTRSEAPFLDEDWPQFKAEAAGDPPRRGTLREPPVFVLRRPINIRANQTNFAACRSAATASLTRSLPLVIWPSAGGGNSAEHGFCKPPRAPARPTKTAKKNSPAAIIIESVR